MPDHLMIRKIHEMNIHLLQLSLGFSYFLLHNSLKLILTKVNSIDRMEDISLCMEIKAIQACIHLPHIKESTPGAVFILQL